MTLEVRGASAAPSKVCSPQNTKFPPASGLKCFWIDTLVSLRIYLLKQQTLFSFQTKILQVFRGRSYAGCMPQTSKGQSAKRNSGARPGPRSRNKANCPAPEGTQVLGYRPPFALPTSRLHQRVGSDLDCPAGAGVLVCREDRDTGPLRVSEEDREGQPRRLALANPSALGERQLQPTRAALSLLQSAPDLATPGSLRAGVGAHYAATQT